MSIVSSTEATDRPEIDGRFWVHEVHTDQLGVAHTRDWLADPGADLAAALAAYAVQLEANLESDEIAANLAAVRSLGAAAVLTFNFSTLAQSVAAFRASFASLSPTDALMTGAFLAAQPDSVLLAWMTQDQLDQLRALPSLQDQASAIQAVVTGS